MPNFKKFYLKATIVNKNHIKLLILIRNNIIGNKIAQPHSFHLTLLSGEINTDHPLSHILFDANNNLTPQFKQLLYSLKDDYAQAFDKSVLSNDGGHNVLLGKKEDLFYVGDGDKPVHSGNFFSKVFGVNHDGNPPITEFRKRFYRKLTKLVGQQQYVATDKVLGGQKCKAIQYNGIDLLFIPDYYYGIGKWTPHISIFQLTELEQHNEPLYANCVANFHKTKGSSEQSVKLFSLILNVLKLNRPIAINMSKDLTFEFNVC